MKIVKVTCFSIATVLAMATTASAGLRQTSVVTITTSGTTKSVLGMVGSTRNSADSTAMIACATIASATTGLSISCFAINPAGTLASCTSNSLSMARAVAAINDDSAISFVVDGTGTCTSVSVGTGSSYERSNS
jgi:hypothetical protein